jgi:dihydrolipoamide dehydrogenase
MAPRYDLCILGAGPAGFAAASRAHDLGKTVALVEPGRLGGAGIHDGALSSKTLWHLALDYARACRSDRGYSGAGLPLAWPDVVGQVRAACAEAEALLAAQLTWMAAPGPRGGRVDLVAGRGRFVASHQVAVATGDGERLVEADHFLIATGSRPRSLPGVDIDGERIVTSDQIERLGALPTSLAIVGAGVVGCEYATVFASFGATAVEILDRQPRILPFEDEDVAASVAASFAGMGIHVHREARLESCRVSGDGVDLAIRCGDTLVSRRVDRVLLAVGRVPSTDGLGLEHAGVALDRGSIVVDGTRTRAAHVWAAGDTTADVMLANMAEIEARHAVEDMFGLAPPPIHYEAQSAIYFFRPEVASVGLNEQMARARGIPYRAAVVSARLLRRNIAMRATDGFVKLLAGADGRLLGLRVVGPQAGSCIQGVALLIAQGGRLEDVDRCVHPHPAVTEGVQEAARLLLGRSVYAPAAMAGLCRVVAWDG